MGQAIRSNAAFVHRACRPPLGPARTDWLSHNRGQRPVGCAPFGCRDA
jgi:hypothetical protein